MPPRQQRRDQTLAQVSRPSRDEHAAARNGSLHDVLLSSRSTQEPPTLDHRPPAYLRVRFSDPYHIYAQSPRKRTIETICETGTLSKNGVLMRSSLYQGKRRRPAPKTPPRAPPAISPEAMMTPRSRMVRPSSPPTRSARRVSQCERKPPTSAGVL